MAAWLSSAMLLAGCSDARHPGLHYRPASPGECAIHLDYMVCADMTSLAPSVPKMTQNTQRQSCQHCLVLVQVLGLTKPQRERQHFLQQVFRSMDGDLSAEIATARNTPHSLGGPDWFKVCATGWHTLHSLCWDGAWMSTCSGQQL